MELGETDAISGMAHLNLGEQDRQQLVKLVISTLPIANPNVITVKWENVKAKGNRACRQAATVQVLRPG